MKKTTKTAKSVRTTKATKTTRSTKATKRTTVATKKIPKPIKHAQTLLRITPKFVHGMVVGAFVGLLFVSFLRAQNVAQALSVTVTRNCDDNSVIYCGALTTTELQQRYGNSGVATIYSYFGITAKDIQDINSIAVVGTVTKSGDVIVNGKTVATNVTTAGRQNDNPSVRHDIDGVIFFTRPPSVSFLSESIPAYVAFNSNGQFIFAILGSCGNPVIGTPVPQATPKPTPTPTPTPKPTPTPTPTPTTPTPTTTTTIPTTTSTPIVTASTTAASLPNTGPGAVIIIALAATIGGYGFHMTHRHIRNKRRNRHTPVHHAI